MLSAPGFHHLHLSSVDPEAAIAFYTRQFPTTSKATWGGLPALQSPNDVLILFTQVATPPPTEPHRSISAPASWSRPGIRCSPRPITATMTATSP